MDINHTWGSDLIIGPSGDLSLVDTDTELKQRILRRLMTNDALSGASSVLEATGDYLFHQDYGASIPRRIGNNLNVDETRSQMVAQMLQEDGVSQNPAPSVTVRQFAGGVECHLKFTSALTGKNQVLEFTVQ